MSRNVTAPIPNVDLNHSRSAESLPMHVPNSVTIGAATLLLGDSADVLPHICCGDACVTDPPYGLSYMGKAWDHSVPDAELWEKVLEALKPGAHLLSFFGSRTYHRGAVQIEDAGFEIRDQVMWLFGSGFPKTHELSKSIDRTLGHKREIVGEQPRLGFNRLLAEQGARKINVTDFGLKSNIPITEQARPWLDWGTALKPAHEPVVLARKPIRGSVAGNVLAHGVGGLNIGGCRVPVPHRIGDNDDTLSKGRFPANLIHDGSDEVLSKFPKLAGGEGTAGHFFYAAKASAKDRDEGLEDFAASVVPSFQTCNGTSNAASSLGEAKGAKRARANNHPTVKPTDLMRYLCRLVTPPGGVVLDPFMGSGSTGKAALQEGFRFIGIERDPEYFEIACARIAQAQGIEWLRAA